MTEALLAEHIARKLAELEGALADRGDAVHSAAVERAAHMRDHAAAQFLRKESAPAYIRDRIASIRDWMKYGELERAYREHETLQLRLDTISRMVRAPFVVTGEKQRRYLAEKRNSGNEKRSADAVERHIAWQRAADGVWARSPKLSKTAVAKIIAGRFPGAQVGTIRRKLAQPG